MKTRAIALILSAASLMFSGPVSAALPDTPSMKFTTEQLARIEDNLLVSLASDSPGARASAALVIRQLKQLVPEYSFGRSVIPLMRIVRDKTCDNVERIAAGLALHELRSERGDYVIKMAARFTEDIRVKRMYEHLVVARAHREEQGSARIHSEREE